MSPWIHPAPGYGQDPPASCQAQTITAASCCSRAGSQGMVGRGGGGAGLPTDREPCGWRWRSAGFPGQHVAMSTCRESPVQERPERPHPNQGSSGTGAQCRRRPRGRAFPTAPSFARRACPPPGSSQHRLRKALRWRPLPWTCSPRSCHPAGGSPRLSPWSSPPPGDWPPQGGRGPGSAPWPVWSTCGLLVVGGLLAG